jgi:hypothetical protein
VDLYIHSPLRLHGVVLNYLSTGTTLPFTHWIGGWVGPRAGLDAVEKREILLLSGIQPRPSSPYPVTIPPEISRPLTTHGFNCGIRWTTQSVPYITTGSVCFPHGDVALSLGRNILPFHFATRIAVGSGARRKT